MYKIILSFRYLFKKRISYLAFLAVALCVFTVIVVMTVITGLVRDFRDSNHKWVGDCVVGTESLVGFPYYEDFIKRVEGLDFVEGASAVVRSYALVKRLGSDDSIGMEVMGIEPVEYGRVTGFGDTLYHHKNDAAGAFEPSYAPSRPCCVVGIDKWLQRDSEGGYNYEISPVEAAISVSCFPLTPKGALAETTKSTRWRLPRAACCSDHISTRNSPASCRRPSATRRSSESTSVLPACAPPATHCSLRRLMHKER